MTKYNVVTEFGTFKRSTKSRAYSHFVVVGPVRADVREHGRVSEIKHLRKLVAEYRKVVETGQCQDARPGRGGDWDRECTAKFLADGSYTKWIAQYEASIAKLEAQGTITETSGAPSAAGWCGRLDLARKEAARHTRYTFVAIIDVATGKEVR